MRTLSAIGSVIAIVIASPASAATVVQDYLFEGTAGGPVANHAGAFSVAYDTVLDSYSLLSFAYDLDGFQFDTSTASMIEWGHPQYLFGGNVSGIPVILTAAASPDFFFTVDFANLTTNSFIYSLGDGAHDVGTLQITRLAQGVPEPATWAMLLLGFGAIGATLRARRAAVRVTYA